MLTIKLTPIYAMLSMFCIGGGIALLVSPAVGLIALGIMFGVVALIGVLA